MEIHEQSRVGEVAAHSFPAVQVFEDYGIDYCCGGGQSIGEACRHKGIDSGTVLQALRGRIREAGPTDRDWSTAPLSELIAYIVSKHHEYLKLELPRLQQRLSKVYATYRDRDNATLAPLPEVFFLMKNELDLHMHKEEMMLFPAIEESERAAKAGWRAELPFGSLANPVRVMLAEHDSAAEALSKIRRATRNYELPSHACSTYRALFQGFGALERDLHVHIHLENNILFPRALSLEAERV